MKLKAPFPYFGGKSRIAKLVWDRLGDPDNFIEPFCGSAAVLLSRPSRPRIETVNDADCYLANFWRATSHDPEAVATHADYPVNECDLHARHNYLVLSDEAARFRERMRSDPEYFDAKIAGWWCWGLCCWIGSGWCTEPGVGWEGRGTALSGSGSSGQRGLNRGATGQDNRKPRIDGGKAQYGHGVHAKGETVQASGVGDKRPKVGGSGSGVHGQLPDLLGDSGASGRGVHASAGPKRIKLSGGTPGSGALGTGVHSNGKPPLDNGIANRPQLADAYSRGRGVNGNDHAEVCADRRAWLLDWFGRLRDRFRTVRVCCGHWLRVCDSKSVTTRLGITSVFLDPPDPTEGGSRDDKLYATDFSGDPNATRDEVLGWCQERGSNQQMRIAVCGYDTDGYAVLEQQGWDVVAWTAAGGYGNRSKKGKANAGRERIWFSPACMNERSLFEALEPV